MRPIDADVLIKLIEEDQAKVPESRIFYDKDAVLGMIAEVPTLNLTEKEKQNEIT